MKTKSFEQKPAMIEIEPKGSYFGLDENGFLINPASRDKLQKEWEPAVNATVDVYKRKFGEHLKNVYIRGSVAKGEAVKGISDLDSFAFVDLDENNIESNWVKEKEELRKKYPFVESFELKADPMSKINMRTLMLNQSFCIYGDPIENIPKLKPGKEMFGHIKSIEKRIVPYRERLENEQDKEKIKRLCTWLMKTFLRTGFEMTMERSKKYTRDLYLCYETFSIYYPKKEGEMREILNFAINPTSDKEKIQKILDNFGTWLLEEKQKYT